MCFIFTCGETEFSKQIQGYEGVVCQCHNCGNYSGRVSKRNPWFTFCFVPVIPLSIHGYEDVVCHICNFSQPLANRQDIQNMKGGQGGQGGSGEPGATGMTPMLGQQGSPYHGQSPQGIEGSSPQGMGSPQPGWNQGSPPPKPEGMQYA